MQEHIYSNYSQYSIHTISHNKCYNVYNMYVTLSQECLLGSMGDVKVAEHSALVEHLAETGHERSLQCENCDSHYNSV